MNIEKHIKTRRWNADRLEGELHRALRQIERETPPERVRMLALTLLRRLRSGPGGSRTAALADR